MDVARSSIMSATTVAAMVAHLREEQRLGGYEAFAEAGTTLRRARLRLAKLTGMDGERVELVCNGTLAMRGLLEAWPFAPGDRVAVPRSEFASNRLALEVLAPRRGLRLVELPADGFGRLDLEASEGLLRRAPVAAIVISHVQSQRGIVQPLADLIAVASRFEVPVLVDGCQAIGHVPGVAGAAAVTGTSRKWLHGPRGVGFVIVADAWRQRLIGAPTLQSHRAVGGTPRADPVKGLFEPDEGPIAAWVGLAAALEQLEAATTDRVTGRLAVAGPTLRRSLAEAAPHLDLGEPTEEPTAIVTIVLRDGAHGTELLRGLARAGIRAGLVPAGRALDSASAVLRLSPAPWVTDADLSRTANVLAKMWPRANAPRSGGDADAADAPFTGIAERSGPETW